MVTSHSGVVRQTPISKCNDPLWIIGTCFKACDNQLVTLLDALQHFQATIKLSSLPGACGEEKLYVALKVVPSPTCSIINCEPTCFPPKSRMLPFLAS